jgi:hypothetical protein
MEIQESIKGRGGFKMIGRTAILLALSCVIGCASSMPMSHTWLSIKGTLQPLVAKERGQVANIPDQKVLEAREKYLADIKQEFIDLDKLGNESLNGLLTKADRNSRTSIAVGTLGALSGITAGVLLVASPANAVWAAAFTGFGTGALGFQTRMAMEGYSRPAIARLFTNAILRCEKAKAEFLTAYNTLVSLKGNPDSEQWDKNAGAAELALLKLRSEVLRVSLPMGEEEDLVWQRKAMEEFSTQLNQVQQTVNEIKKGPPPPPPAP